ncbi:MAG: PAS domain S-box protein, partial [Candidatus Aenigmatarchaeota archaeon]
MENIHVLWVDLGLEEERPVLEDIEDGINLSVALSKKRASRLLTEREFDAFVYVDNKDPLSGGFELIERVKEKNRNEIPLMICTNEDNIPVALEALTSGIGDNHPKTTDLKSKDKGILEFLSEEVECFEIRAHQDSSSVKDIEEIEEMENSSLLDPIADWVWEMNKEGIHTYSNAAVKDILGYEVEEIIGTSSWDLWPEEDKEKMDKDEFKEILKKEDGWESYPGRFKHKDGSIKYLESTGVPIYDENGELKGYRGIDRDITRRKKAEKREKLLHSLLRHDIKNKLQISKAYLQLIEDLDISDEARELLVKTQKSVEEEENLIQKIEDLIKVYRKEGTEKVAVEKYLDKSLENVDSLLKDSDVSISVEKFDEKVYGDDLLEELFTNILENSLKHSNCREMMISKEENPDEIVVVFKEDGEGIPDEEKENIFEKGYKGDGSK